MSGLFFGGGAARENHFKLTQGGGGGGRHSSRDVTMEEKFPDLDNLSISGHLHCLTMKDKYGLPFCS